MKCFNTVWSVWSQRYEYSVQSERSDRLIPNTFIRIPGEWSRFARGMKFNKQTDRLYKYAKWLYTSSRFDAESAIERNYSPSAWFSKISQAGRFAAPISTCNHPSHIIRIIPILIPASPSSICRSMTQSSLVVCGLLRESCTRWERARHTVINQAEAAGGNRVNPREGNTSQRAPTERMERGGGVKPKEIWSRTTFFCVRWLVSFITQCSYTHRRRYCAGENWCHDHQANEGP